MKMTSDQNRELIQLLMDVDGHSKAAAKQVLNGLAPEGRLAELHQLRRIKLERSGLRQLEEGGAKPSTPPAKGATKPKKVPYTLLMQPEQLEALRSLAEKDDTSVSHHIRQAVRAYLRTRLV
ncbi:ribbon-helix-helix protein, CopG family [Pseudomonas aeruginosa]